MPVFKERLTVEIAWGVKAFLKVDAGLTRGGIPERELEKALRQRDEYREQLQQTKKQLEQAQQKLRQGRQRPGKDGKRGQKGNQPKQKAREYLLNKMPKQSICAEIGVDEGKFSRQILDITSPKRLHLIDPWKHEPGNEYERSRYGGFGSDGQAIMEERYREVAERFAGEIRAGQVEMHRKFSNEISEDFEDSYFDWIYIDGNHLYEFVKQDLKLYYPKIKPGGGYMSGDDYGVEGWWRNGVQKAVDEFVSRNPDLNLEVRGSQFIIQKGTSASNRPAEM